MIDTRSFLFETLRTEIIQIIQLHDAVLFYVIVRQGNLDKRAHHTMAKQKAHHTQ